MNENASARGILFIFRHFTGDNKMGLYNILKLNLKCPFCNYEGEMEAEFKIGYLNLDIYNTGDKIKWVEGLAKQPHQKRPEGGNFCGEGYVECQNCNKDFWLEIFIENDRITKAKINFDKAGYVKKS
ncbi:MAG TPA: hypothetical protein PLK32_08405 [Defluviitoga tunisiensis]|nr:hypothetical protein [Defluviitoga tunisiensis]